MAQTSWQRRFPFLEQDLGQLSAALPGRFSGQRVARASPLQGGLRNTNYQIWLEGQAEPRVLRLYVADASACRREAAIASLLAGSVPLAEVLASDPDRQPPLAVLRWIDGVRFDQLLRRATAAEAGRGSRAAGQALAAIHRQRFSTGGWFDAELAVSQPLMLSGGGWAAAVSHFAALPEVRRQLGPDLSRQLPGFVERVHDRIPAEDDARLVHADFKPWNLLLRPDASWQVAAVLDWEFALAGPPLVDFGIYLRDLDELPASYASELAAGYREAGGELPDGWAELGRLYDVLSLCSMLETARDAASLREMRRLLANTIASLG